MPCIAKDMTLAMFGKRWDVTQNFSKIFLKLILIFLFFISYQLIFIII